MNQALPSGAATASSAQPPGTFSSPALVSLAPAHTSSSSSSLLSSPSSSSSTSIVVSAAKSGIEPVALLQKTTVDTPQREIDQTSSAASTDANPTRATETTNPMMTSTKTATTAVRRSGRSRSSTTIQVDGHTIKKENNYTVNETTYVHNAVPDQTAQPSVRRQSTRAVAAKKPPVPRKPTAAELLRREQKEALQKNVELKAGARRQFLRKHIAQLEPFCEDKVLEQLKEQPGDATSAATTAAAAAATETITNDTTNFFQPESITADLRDYQLQGLEWMASMHAQNIGFILGDEMGLGKTLQTISLICHLKEARDEKDVSCPSLVVCPLSVLDSWENEIKKWAPSLKYFLFHASNTEIAASSCAEKLSKVDIIVTTYDMIKAPSLARVWQYQYYQLVVLDEGHLVKNAETLVSKAVRRLKCETRAVLTGTPVANTLSEFWALLNFLIPDVFTDGALPLFDGAFNLTLNVVDSEKLALANGLVKIFMIRRLKTQVEKLMPKKIETKICCPLSKTQVWWYKAILMKDLKLLTKGKGKSNAKLLNNLIMQLRKTCLHPYLFPDADPYLASPETTQIKDLIGASGKLAVLDKLLCSLYRKKHRVVLFSQLTSMLDILEDYCQLRWKGKYCRFDGGTLRAARNYTIRSFNEKDSPLFLFLMSTRSGGMGINLQTADTCILYDSDWNPQPDIQAMARVHRIGQSKTVHVYRLVTEGTVEERMVERAQKKLYLDRMVTRDGTDQEQTMEAEQTSEKLMETLRFGCNAVFGDDSKNNSLPTNEDIDLITDRTRTEDFSKGKLKGGADESAKDFNATKKFKATTDFSGIDFLQIRRQVEKKKRQDEVSNMSQIGEAWRRQRKSRIKMVNAKGSGYGSAVPVLVANDYDLETGEQSVFQRELGKNEAAAAAVIKKKKSGPSFVSLDSCQCCGDGGTLVCCPRCPVSLHLRCIGLRSTKQFLSCPHHSCSICGKTASLCGGFLYPCDCCPNSYCEEHLPKDARVLRTNERMEERGYTIKHGVYIHCSKQCERVAETEFGWKKPRVVGAHASPCPRLLDVSSHFGGIVDDSLEAPDDVLVHDKRKRPRRTAASTSSPRAMGKQESLAPRTSSTGPAAQSATNEDDDEIEIVKVVPSKNTKPKNRVAESKKNRVAESKGDPLGSVFNFETDYVASVPVTEDGMGLRIEPSDCHSKLLFGGYRKLAGGRISPAAEKKVFRQAGDEIIAIDGRAVSNMPFREVVEFLQQKDAGQIRSFHMRRALYYGHGES